MSRFRQFLFGLLTGLASAGLIIIVTRRPAGKAVELRPPPEPPGVRVHVTGAVAAPGVYTLPPGSIVQDALEIAGGALPEADLSSFNLAAHLTDGAQLAVPARPRPALPASTPDPSRPALTLAPTAAPAAVTESGLVNINTATVEELDTLPGVGPSIAQKIADYREANGPFQTVGDLINVSGIGPATLEKIRPLATVDSDG